MIMNKIVLVAALLLAGCAHNIDTVKPELAVASRVEYVIKLPPKELMSIPAPVVKIDVDAAKQSDVAKWLVASEERMKTLEDQIIALGAFFVNEQSKLDDKAKVENVKSSDAAISTQANEASGAIAEDITK
jgi:hypothetical protein